MWLGHAIQDCKWFYFFHVKKFNELCKIPTGKNFFETGFREKSRKIVIYASDAGIHIAGDGKLAGLVDPNDGQCSLDNNDRYYARAEQQDYPTIEQVSWIEDETAADSILWSSDLYFL